MEALWSDILSPSFWVAAGQIIGVTVILSGDNAVVIALGLPDASSQSSGFGGMVLGAGVAALLRVIFTLVVAQAMVLPFLKLAGGLLLLWVAVKLLVPEEEDEGKIEAADNPLACGACRRHRRHRDEPRQRHRDRRLGGNGGVPGRSGPCDDDLRARWSSLALSPAFR